MNQKLQTAWLERKKFCAEGGKLWVEGNKLWAEGDKLRKDAAEGNKLWAEGNKLRAEGSKLRAEGDIIWLTAVIEVYGDVPLKWDGGDKCILNVSETYK